MVCDLTFVRVRTGWRLRETWGSHANTCCVCPCFFISTQTCPRRRVPERWSGMSLCFDFCLNWNHHESGHSSEDNEMVEQVKTLACECMNNRCHPGKGGRRELLSLRLSLSIHRYTVPHMHTPLHIYIHDDDTTKSMIWKEPRVNPLADCSRDPVPCTRLERRVCFAHGNLSSQNLWVWGTWLCNSC